jgi:predicted DCC family thiol-disulfide oxidoreductase YuxK
VAPEGFAQPVAAWELRSLRRAWRVGEAGGRDVDEFLAAQCPDRPTLLYDDGCRFCRAMAELLFRLARRRELAFLPWSTPRAEAWLCGLPAGVRDASMHLKLPDGALVSGDGVLGATLARVRGLKWLAWLGRRLPPAGRLLAWSYGLVARHRDLLSRLVPERPPVMREPGIAAAACEGGQRALG